MGQRQRKVLYQRLKVPPSINQFQNSLDKNLSINLFKLLHKYRPEDKQSKKERVQGEAEKKEAGAEDDKKKPISIKFGINHMWLPAVCRKMDIPYCIVKSKSRLG